MKKQVKTFYNIEKDKKEPYTKVVKREKISVREIHDLEVTNIYWRDPDGELWLNPDNPMENSKNGFSVYRQRKGYLQPEEIRAVREKTGISLNKFAELIGIGKSSLSQIENNLRVQSKEQDSLFKLIKAEVARTGKLESLTCHHVSS